MADKFATMMQEGWGVPLEKGRAMIHQVIPAAHQTVARVQLFPEANMKVERRGVALAEKAHVTAMCGVGLVEVAGMVHIGAPSVGWLREVEVKPLKQTKKQQASKFERLSEALRLGMNFDVERLQERSDVEGWEIDFARLAWSKITSWMVKKTDGAYDEATLMVAARKCDRKMLGLILQKCKANNIVFVKDALGLPEPKKKVRKAQPKSKEAKRVEEERARAELKRAAQAAREAEAEQRRAAIEAAEEQANAVKQDRVVQAVSAHLQALTERQRPPAVRHTADDEVKLAVDFAGIVSLSAALGDQSEVAKMVQDALRKPCGMACTRYLQVLEMLGAGKVNLPQHVLDSMRVKAQYEQAVRDVDPTGVTAVIADPAFPGQLRTDARLVERQVRACRDFFSAAAEGGVSGLQAAWPKLEKTRASVQAISTELDIFDAAAKSESQLLLVSGLAEVMDGAAAGGFFQCASSSGEPRRSPRPKQSKRAAHRSASVTL